MLCSFVFIPSDRPDLYLHTPFNSIEKKLIFKKQNILLKHKKAYIFAQEKVMLVILKIKHKQVFCYKT